MASGDEEQVQSKSHVSEYAGQIMNLVEKVNTFFTNLDYGSEELKHQETDDKSHQQEEQSLDISIFAVSLEHDVYTRDINETGTYILPSKGENVKSLTENMDILYKFKQMKSNLEDVVQLTKTNEELSKLIYKVKNFVNKKQIKMPSNLENKHSLEGTDIMHKDPERESCILDECATEREEKIHLEELEQTKPEESEEFVSDMSEETQFQNPKRTESRKAEVDKPKNLEEIKFDKSEEAELQIPDETECERQEETKPRNPEKTETKKTQAKSGKLKESEHEEQNSGTPEKTNPETPKKSQCDEQKENEKK